MWRVPAGRELRWRSWDGEHLVYHANSGDTHRLNAVGASVLRAIEGSGVETGQLVDRVAADLQVERSTLIGPIAELLARFEDLGLIESIDEPGSRSHGSRDR
jgi:PqqD family protein of HPr-rel-A system